MKKTRITISLILTLVLALFTLVSCSGAEQPVDSYSKAEVDAIIAELNVAITNKTAANGLAISALETEYAIKISELEAKDKIIEEEITDLAEEYEAKVTELATEDKKNSDALTTLKARYDAQLEALVAKDAEYTDAIAAIEAKIDDLMYSAPATEGTIAELKAEYDAQIAALKAANGENESKIAELEAKIEALENGTADLGGAIDELKAEYDAQIAALKATSGEYESKIAELEAKIEALENGIADLEGTVAELKAEYDAQIEALTLADFANETKINTLISEFDLKKTELEAKDMAIATELEALNNFYTQKISELEVQVFSNEADIRALELELETEINNLNSALNSEIASLKSQINTLNSKQVYTKTEIDAIVSELKAANKATADALAALENQHKHALGEWEKLINDGESCDGSVLAATCSECRAVELKRGTADDHNFANGVCIRCGEKEASSTPYTREGNKILFGTYPQSEVTDGSLTAELTAKAGALPTSTSAGRWTSYGYYVSGKISDYMWYIDVEKDGEKYRGVYFTSYRPYYCDSNYPSDDTYQDENGYNVSTVYWFKYEPISWTVLEETNGTALIFCDMIIDSQQYDYDESGSYSNNYANSTIRAWLNETFLQTAFGALEQAIIETTLVNNTPASTSSNMNPNACENTNDKIFLLSYKEATNSAYGFSSYDDYDALRQKKMTDYAQSQGGALSDSSSYLDNGFWWLRSPSYSGSLTMSCVAENGSGNVVVYANCTAYGVVPALRIRL